MSERTIWLSEDEYRDLKDALRDLGVEPDPVLDLLEVHGIPIGVR